MTSLSTLIFLFFNSKHGFITSHEHWNVIALDQYMIRREFDVVQMYSDEALSRFLWRLMNMLISWNCSRKIEYFFSWFETSVTSISIFASLKTLSSDQKKWETWKIYLSVIPNKFTQHEFEMAYFSMFKDTKKTNTSPPIEVKIKSEWNQLSSL